MADPFATIDLDELEAVTGGRYSKLGKKNEIKPELIQAIGELAKAVTGVGQNLAQVQTKKNSEQMQFLQELMKRKSGKG